MSEARQCDRCNKFYSINDKNEKRGEYPITEDYKKPVGSMTLYDNNTNRIKHLDLCPECSRSLIVWLNDWGQYEEDEKENDINHINCPYRKDVVCAPNNDGNHNCVMCDVYKQIFVRQDFAKEKDCRYCKYDQYDYKLSEHDPCADCNEHDRFESKEDKECSKEENTSST